MTQKILIVDDDKEIRNILVNLLKDKYQTYTAQSGTIALKALVESSYDLVLLDVMMPYLDGKGTLKEIKTINPKQIVIMLTAYANIKDAVECTKMGAYNYLSKPTSKADLLEAIERAFQANSMINEISYCSPILQSSEIIGKSTAIKEVFEIIAKVANVDTAILIRGESGTGKELVARTIHINSNRKNEKFVAINCSALPETLIESELFGHEKGAFTGAQTRKIGKFQYANEGTLFLDEIGDIPSNIQVKLLRFLQDKTFTPIGINKQIEVDVRIIAATNRNLEELIKQKLFREDLFYRLNVLPIYLPPLRTRKDDIEALINHFISKFNTKLDKTILSISEQVLHILSNYDWPGNIRELENVIEHAFVVETGQIISISSLPQQVLGTKTISTDPTQLDFQRDKEEFEKQSIQQALQKYKGKLNLTAKAVNIPKKTLLRKIKKYNINREIFSE